uniref:FMN-binding protein n=1 Tax=Kutzneria sp. (strain 744) TaxID=345341 RepID=UPI0039A3F8B3
AGAGAMFVPGPYHAPEDRWLVDLVRGHPLAQLASNGAGGAAPHITHVPIIVDPELDGPVDRLVGITLWGHMNRANPHWAALGGAANVVATFAGPNAYVSPAVYRTAPAAPTWNFTSVQVRGELRKVESADDTLATVRATVAALESRFGAGWDMTGSLDYFRRILPGVGAFRLRVAEADGMFKLSQEQQPAIRRRVRHSFGGAEATRAVAGLMDRLPTE